MMKLTIGKKLGIILIAVAVLLPLAVIINFYYGNKSIQLAEQTRTESFVFAMKATDMRKAVTEVQQYLSDISATRGAKGYDDGFDKARSQAEEFTALARDFEEMFTREGDVDNKAAMEQISTHFAAYYQLGQKMAGVYIEAGPDQGNKLMEEFDPLADQITYEIKALADGQSKELTATCSISHQASGRQ